MKKIFYAIIWLSLIGITKAVYADYPIVSHRYIADPGALVYNGRVYVYCSNDDENVSNSSYQMSSIVCVSSSDMKNWTDHGVVFDVPRDASWSGLSWAPSPVYKNGKFYLYFGNGGSAIGVAVSDNPTGPFKDPVGRAIVNGSTPGVQPFDGWLFDPMTFIDDDGQAYMYFGGNGDGNLRVVKLNNDLISVNGSAGKFNVPNFFEAAWVHKHNGVYYFSYSTNPGAGMRIDYMTSTNPMSGFTYKGVMSPQPPNNNNNNHQAVFQLNNQWYQMYHNRIVASQTGIPTTYKRNLAIDAFSHRADGTIIQMVNTTNGIVQVGRLNPFVRTESETMSDQRGIETEVSSAGGMNLTLLDNNDFTMVEGVDFGSVGATTIATRVASTKTGGTIEIRLGSSTGTIIGTVVVPNTGGRQTWQTVNTAVTRTTGIHNVYFIFKGGSADLFNVDYWTFSTGTPNTPPTISLTSPITNANFTSPATISIAANAVDTDGTISNVQFYNGTTLLGSDATSPYSFSWTNVAAGTYSLTAKATDNSGAVTTSTPVTVTVSNPVVQAPFGGTAALIPGKIEAENYDIGGQGVAFNETTTGNSGNSYRTDNVDVEATGDTGGGYNVGWIASGEWLEYTVNVVSTGTYTIEARVASINNGGSLHVEMDGQNISGSITVPNTSAWQTYQTIVVPNISLTAGQKIMRIAMDVGSFNINYVYFTSVVQNIPPTVSITAPANNASFTASASITITANASDVDGTVSSVQFYNGTTLLGSDATSPYSFSWTNVAAGTYSLTAKATDNSGTVTTSTAVTITVSNPVVQTPFGGTAALIPGKIEAENYDVGGQGVAFNETTTGNSGNVFRTDDVDVETTGDTGGGYNIGWIASGEWLEYTVNVVSTGTYTIEARVASANTGGSFHIEMDGQNISGAITVPSTSAWQTYQTIVVPNISLTAGQKIMRIAMDGSWFNLNYVNFTNVISNTTIQAETACLVDGTLNETFNTGFRGTGYVNTNNTIGSSASWHLNSATAQTISLEIRYAHTTTTGRPMSLSVNGVTQVSSIAFGPTASNTTWATATVQISLASGNNIVRLVSTSTAGSPYLDELVYGSGTVSAGSCPAARIGEMEEAVFMTSIISPNPSESVFRLRTKEEVKLITVVNELGVIMPGSFIREEEELVFGERFTSGLYVVVIEYFSGRIETRIIQKL